MASCKSFSIVFGLVLFVGFTLARPANDKDTVTDVHLNAVLPDSEKAAVKLVESVHQDAAHKHQDSLPASSTRANLELVPEEEQSTTESDITIVTQRPSYFSRLIQSIFDIPISVLQSVRNLIQTTAYKGPQQQGTN